MAWTFHISVPPVDFRSQYFEFRVKFRPQSEGNPSTSFPLVGAAMRPVLGSPYAQMTATKLHWLEKVDADARAAGTNGFLGMFICLYQIDSVQVWITTSEIHEDNVPPHRPTNKPWYWFPKYCTDFGLAFRIVGRSETWKPGLMGKAGNKRVWKERTTKELAAQGISLSRES